MTTAGTSHHDALRNHGPTALTAALSPAPTSSARLAHGADPALREDHGTGRSPLDWANDGPHPETAAVLIAAGGAPRTSAG
ncbi:hypothetical protein [Streptomyces thinghirensis]|uniref:Ankyrin repeat domain-containing protein n=1 Tax=Streptomyces thinghirensis TaxID=551547 RepID=A0ABP9T4L9_9ACTN